MRHRNDFISDESGPTATEYAVCLASILMVVIGVVAVFGDKIGSMFESIKNTVL